MVCMRNQLNPSDTTGNSLPPRPAIERVGCTQSLIAQLVPDQAPGGDVDVPRHLGDKQRRQLEPSPIMMAIMRRLLEEHHNELTNNVTKHLADVIKPSFVNTLHEFASEQGTSNNSVQMETNHPNPTVSRYVPSLITAQITFDTVVHLCHLHHHLGFCKGLKPSIRP